MNRDSKIDPAALKAQQRLAWSRAAEGWERWWDAFERSAQSVSDRLVELAGVAPGQRVLDLATGIGEPALTAARRVGAAGRVVAVDQAPLMLAVARRRMASLGLPNVEFVEGDLDALELAERFHAIVSRWGLMFSLDLDALLARLVERLLPGGRLAAAVWGAPAQVPLISLPGRVVRDALSLPDPPPGMPTAFDLADAERLRTRFAAAGLTELVVEWHTVTVESPSAEEFTRFVRDIAPPIPELERQSERRRNEIWAAVAEAARRFARPDGSVAIPNQTLIVAGASRAPAVGAGATPSTAGGRQARCPFCGSGDTRLESAFGSTLGLAQYWCGTCRTVFEYLKWEEDGEKV